MNAIVAVDQNWGIGKDNDLLVRLPSDLQYYKEKTQGRCVIFGQRTLESLPGGKPLPKRNHIVLSDDMNFEIPLRKNMIMSDVPGEGTTEEKPYTCTLCHTKDEVLEAVRAVEAADDDPEAVFICGGASIYELFLEDCDAFYVTRIEHVFDADRFFPNLEEHGFHMTWASEPMEEEGYTYRFTKYERA